MADNFTIAHILADSTNKNQPYQADIETLLAHSISPDYTKLDLIKDANQIIKPQSLRRFNRYLKLYQRGCPVAYIIGHQEFMSLDFITGPGVLIPRPETEFVVEAALAVLKGIKQPTVLDVGTGSGNIAVSIARHSNNPGIRIYASDISRRALAIARRNTRRHKVSDSITFCKGNLFRAFSKHRLENRVDVIVSNPPYVSPAEYARLPVSVRRYEPRQALYAPDRGLSFYKQIITQAPAYLKPGGYLILEMGYRQSALIQKLVAKNGYFDNIRAIKDYNRIERIIIGRRCAQS